MTKPLFTVLLPHLRNASNDAALRVCLDCLVANTGLNFELMVQSVAERRDIYTVLNDMTWHAKTDWIVPWNTDVFAAPGWAEPMWTARETHTIVSPVMVECGAIPVNDRNLEMNFGRTPETFRRAEFERWVQTGGGWRDDWKEDEAAWYFPSLFERGTFLGLDGFDTTIGAFPDPLDMDLWKRWTANGGKFKRVRSYMYHLQVWSDQTRGVRDV